MERSAPRRTSTSSATPLCSRARPARPCWSRSAAARASASTPSATRCGSSTRPDATRTDGSWPSARASSATPAPTPASATRCSSAPPVTPAAGTACPTSTSRRRPSTRTTRPAARCAASAPTRRTSPIEGILDRARRAGRHRRLGDPLAERARRRRPLRHRAELGPRRGLKKTLLAVRDAYRERALRRHRLRRQEHRHRQRHARARPRDPAAGGRRVGDALPLLDGDGPGRAHRAPADRVRGARPAARARPGRRRHRARARHGPDDGVALDRARRQRRDRRRPGAARPRSTAAASRSSPDRSSAASSSSTGRRARADVDEPVTHLAYGWATQVVILDDDGTAREGDRRPRRRPGDQPAARRGPDRGCRAHGARPGALGGVRRRGRRPGHRDAEVAAHDPADAACPRSSASSSRSRSRKGRTARRASARRRSCRPPQRRRRAVRVRRHPSHTPADEGLAGRARCRAAPRAREGRGMIVTSLDPVAIVDGDLWVDDGRIAAAGEGRRIALLGGARRSRQRLRAHAPLLGARPRHAVRARAAARASSRSSSASGGGSTARSTRTSIRASALVGGDGGAALPGRRRSSTTTPRRTRSTARST